MNIEQMKQEAINRMKKLQLLKDPIKAFQKKNAVWVSEDMGRMSVLYFLPGYTYEKQVRNVLEKVAKRYPNVMPYHVIVNHVGPELSDIWCTVLYVSKNEDEWDYERPDGNYTLSAIVMNQFDEFDVGDVQVMPLWGALKRTA